MPLLKDVTACSTRAARGLSRQLIAEMNLMIPGGVLVNIDDLKVEAASDAVTAFLQPAAKEALREAIQERRGATLRISSSYRTVAQQYLLFRQAQEKRCGVTLAARPGRSNHEDGLAIDTPDPDAWRGALEANGWHWLGPSDRVHFTYSGGGTRDDLGDIGVRAFQRLWNRYNPNDRVSEDGDFGPQTAVRLGRAPADGFAPPRVLYLSEPAMTGDDVRRIELALRDAGFNSDSDGRYDPETAKAVRQFQTERGLKADGIVGMATRKELGVLY
jgi:hypothetical protein